MCSWNIYDISNELVQCVLSNSCQNQSNLLKCIDNCLGAAGLHICGTIFLEGSGQQFHQQFFFISTQKLERGKKVDHGKKIPKIPKNIQGFPG